MPPTRRGPRRCFGLTPEAQSFHAVSGVPLPETVESSIECDIFLFAASPHRRTLETGLGANSDYFAHHGFYLHAVGAGTVIPPPGWEGRLQPVRDEHGTTWARAIEIHDAAACKLMAGREKDFEFLRDTIRSGVIRLDTLLERAVSFRTTRLANALASRLQRLCKTLRQSRLFPEAEAVRQVLVGFASMPSW